jgi:hypothetical protein
MTEQMVRKPPAIEVLKRAVFDFIDAITDKGVS